jgi:small GTP-binding protein
MSLSAKVVIVGPKKVGKTVLANFLSEAFSTDTTSQYRPTRGCRILQFEPESTDGQRSDVMVELWDISGDEKYASSWPAIAKGVHGALVVFDINKEGQEDNLEIWFKKFIRETGLRSGQCIVVANNPSNEEPIRSDVTVGGKLAKAKLVLADIAQDPDGIRDAFFQLMKGVRESVVKLREAQEMVYLS